MKYIGILALIVASLFLTNKVFISNSSVDTKDKNSTEEVVSNRVVNLSNQNLANVPNSVFDKTDVEELNLSHNSLTGSLQSQIGKLTELKVLNLSNNKFTGVPAEVGQLKDLEILDLSNNEITGLPYEIGNLMKLKVLDLRGNNYSKQDLLVIKQKLPQGVEIKID